MSAFAAAGAAFLIAVLWFDLMFDVQVRASPGAVVPAEALTSISAYYRRVTTDARPMNRLISTVMLVTLGTVIAEIWRDVNPRWLPWVSLVLTASPIGLALRRTVPNAMRLGRAEDSPEMRSTLAHAIYRDHLFCAAAMILLLALQLSLQVN